MKLCKVIDFLCLTIYYIVNDKPLTENSFKKYLMQFKKKNVNLIHNI